MSERNLLKNPNGDEVLTPCKYVAHQYFLMAAILEGYRVTLWSAIKGPYQQRRVLTTSDRQIGQTMEGVDQLSAERVLYEIIKVNLCLKRQVIDLLAEGYTPEELDGQPAVHVEDWYCSRIDCGCTYELTVCLLDENHKLIQEFKPDPVTLDPDTDDCSWRQITHTFSEYGPGLRFISFEHGGQDTKYWDGWFAVRVTASSVTIKL